MNLMSEERKIDGLIDRRGRGNVKRSYRWFIIERRLLEGGEWELREDVDPS